MHDSDLSQPADDPADFAGDRRQAMRYVTEAFAEAERDGLDGDCMVHAALFAAFRHLVEVYGEEPTAVFAENLPDRIRNGGFTTARRH